MPAKSKGVAKVQRRQPEHRPDLSPTVLNRFQAAAYLLVGLSKLADLTAIGEIPSVAIGVRSNGAAGRRVYRISDLDDWLEAKAAESSRAAS